MPLHSDNPVRVPGPFHRLHDSIGGMGRDPQPAARLIDRLVVGRIYVRSGRAGKLQHAAGVELRAVHRVRAFSPVWRLVFFGAVANPRSKFAGDVLDQAASQKNIQGLHPVADCQHWLARTQSVFQQREISSFARGIGIDGGWVALRPEMCRVYIGRAARQQERIQFRRPALQLSW